MSRRVWSWTGPVAAFVAGGVLAWAALAIARGDGPEPPRPVEVIVAEQAQLAEGAIRELEEEQRLSRRPAHESFHDMRLWARRLAEARLARAGSAEERAAAIRPFYDLLRDHEAEVEALIRAGILGRRDGDEVRYQRLEAERWLARESAR